MKNCKSGKRDRSLSLKFKPLDNPLGRISAIASFAEGVAMMIATNLLFRFRATQSALIGTNTRNAAARIDRTNGVVPERSPSTMILLAGDVEI